MQKEGPDGALLQCFYESVQPSDGPFLISFFGATF